MVTSKKKVVFNKESPWSEISSRFCRFHGLPYGSALKIIYTNNAKYPKGRIQRNNTIYRRAVFRKGTLERALGNEKVSTLVDEHLLPYIDIDLKALGAEIAAFGPDGNRLDRKTHIATWRDLPALPTEEELEAESEREREIAEIADEARGGLANLSEFRWDPEETVPRGVIRALIQRYGRSVVEGATRREL